MTFLKILLISFVFCVNFITVTDGETCSNSNQVGTCSMLSCGNHCEKRRCMKNEKPAAPNVATISYITVGGCVLFAIIVVVAVMVIRSRRLRRDGNDRKMSVRSAGNTYTFRNYPRPPTSGPAISTLNLHPPLPPLVDEDENPYEYETVDFPEPKPQRTNKKVEETEDGYLLATPLTKPKLPPPRIYDPTD